MISISDEEFEQLFGGIRREAIHLETRDAYGTEVELPYMAKWAAGEPDDLAWMQDWAATLRRHVAAGRSVRRARIVSEPLSDYQRWSYGIAQVMVDAGEDIRWVPRRLMSAVSIPGNDFYVFDDAPAMFLHYAGNGLGVDKTTTEDPEVIRLCRTAFEEVWKIAVPHRDYHPV